MNACMCACVLVYRKKKKLVYMYIYTYLYMYIHILKTRTSEKSWQSMFVRTCVYVHMEKIWKSEYICIHTYVYAYMHVRTCLSGNEKIVCTKYRNTPVHISQNYIFQYLNADLKIRSSNCVREHIEIR
jgi:hypothetical protein